MMPDTPNFNKMAYSLNTADIFGDNEDWVMVDIDRKTGDIVMTDEYDYILRMFLARLGLVQSFPPLEMHLPMLDEHGHLMSRDRIPCIETRDCEESPSGIITYDREARRNISATQEVLKRRRNRGD